MWDDKGVWEVGQKVWECGGNCGMPDLWGGESRDIDIDISNTLRHVCIL